MQIEENHNLKLQKHQYIQQSISCSFIRVYENETGIWISMIDMNEVSFLLSFKIWWKPLNIIVIFKYNFLNNNHKYDRWNIIFNEILISKTNIPLNLKCGFKIQ